MPRKKARKPKVTIIGWAFLALIFLITLLTGLWILKPLVKTRRHITSPPLTESSSSLRPKIAIIIDDMGQNPKIERKFFKLTIPLTFSFLPYAPYTRTLALEAYKKGFEIMIHLPLQAQNHSSPPGTITLSMGKKEVQYWVKQAIVAVPYAVGVNHHMGSLLSQNRKHMRWILETIASAHLFYIDSRTTPKSIIPLVAKEIKIPFAQRKIFLDNQLNEQYLENMLEMAIKKARKEKKIIVIGHPHPQTLKILQKKGSWLSKQVQLVKASEIVRP